MTQGVPVCSIPISADQPVTARLVERAGAGLSCATGEIRLGPFALPRADLEQLDPLMIRRQIRRVAYEPDFAERARALLAEIAELTGLDQVVRLVEAILTHEGRNLV